MTFLPNSAFSPSMPGQSISPFRDNEQLRVGPPRAIDFPIIPRSQTQPRAVLGAVLLDQLFSLFYLYLNRRDARLGKNDRLREVDIRSGRNDRLGRVEGVMRVHILVRKERHSCFCAECYADALERELRVLGAGEVAERYEHLAVLDRCRNADRACKLIVVRNDGLDRLRSLMSLEHIENVIGGGDDAILAARQEERVQVVAKLCDVRHSDLIAVVVEYIERERGNDRVAHRALLLEEIITLAGARSVGMPAAPLVNDELEVMSSAVSADDAPISENDLLHSVSLNHHRVPLFVRKRERISRSAAVVVHSKAGGLIVDVRYCAVSPIVFHSVRAASVKLDVTRHVLHDRRVSTALVSIKLGAHMSAAAPILVAHTPERNVKRLGMSVLLALERKRGASLGRKAVVHPISYVHRSSCGKISRKVSLCSDHFAKIHKFVRSHLVGLVSAVVVVPPIYARGTILADTVSPIVSLCKTASRPAKHGGIDSLELLDDVLSEAANVGDLRVFTDPESVIENAAYML